MDVRLTFDPDRAFHELEKAAEEHAQAEYDAARLEELKGVLLSQIMVEKGDVSAAKAEMLAKADPRYTQHIEGMCEARRRANRAKARYRDLLVLSDMRRSQEATLRSLKV